MKWREYYCVGRTQNSKILLGFESCSMLRFGTRYYSVERNQNGKFKTMPLINYLSYFPVFFRKFVNVPFTKNLLGMGFDQKLYNKSSHCVGTRRDSVHMFENYVSRPILKFLSCVTSFTGRFETVPFTTKTIYVFWRWNKECRMGMALPRTHPHCVRIELITRQILEALQRETGTRHMLTDQQWLKDYDDGEIQGRRKENEKSTTTHLRREWIGSFMWRRTLHLVQVP